MKRVKLSFEQVLTYEITKHDCSTEEIKQLIRDKDEAVSSLHGLTDEAVDLLAAGQRVIVREGVRGNGWCTS